MTYITSYLITTCCMPIDEEKEKQNSDLILSRLWAANLMIEKVTPKKKKNQKKL